MALIHQGHQHHGSRHRIGSLIPAGLTVTEVVPGAEVIMVTACSEARTAVCPPAAWPRNGSIAATSGVLRTCRVPDEPCASASSPGVSSATSLPARSGSSPSVRDGDASGTRSADGASRCARVSSRLGAGRSTRSELRPASRIACEQRHATAAGAPARRCQASRSR